MARFSWGNVTEQPLTTFWRQLDSDLVANGYAAATYGEARAMFHDHRDNPMFALVVERSWASAETLAHS